MFESFKNSITIEDFDFMSLIKKLKKEGRLYNASHDLAYGIDPKEITAYVNDDETKYDIYYGNMYFAMVDTDTEVSLSVFLKKPEDAVWDINPDASPNNETFRVYIKYLLYVMNHRWVSSEEYTVGPWNKYVGGIMKCLKEYLVGKSNEDDFRKSYAVAMKVLNKFIRKAKKEK